MERDKSKTIMSEEQFLRRTRSHRTALVSWLIGSLLIASLSYAIKEWSITTHGWQAEVVYGLFYFIFGIGSISTLCFGFYLYEWFKQIESEAQCTN